LLTVYTLTVYSLTVYTITVYSLTVYTITGDPVVVANRMASTSHD
jgi:hypothetical protein